MNRSYAKTERSFGPKSGLVLLSGGLDSAVNLAAAVACGMRVSALTVDYGQRAAEREVESAVRLAGRYDIRHDVIRLNWFPDLCPSKLTGRGRELPLLKEGDLDRRDVTLESARAVWVPNRNGLLMNIAGALAESRELEAVIVGFNAEEGATFPDNTEACIEAMNELFKWTTASSVSVHSFTTQMTKREIARLGADLKVPFDLIWSCYEGGKSRCEQCESCLRFARALKSL
ncbi:MAG: 7-cyano-7-deazaguanine synthase QueC [Deltaproteobacteria bacterium]|nr:7-cyano-7-deazaguanine synthase QueC [Deltaproteobacteria bacterium]